MRLLSGNMTLLTERVFVANSRDESINVPPATWDGLSTIVPRYGPEIGLEDFKTDDIVDLEWLLLATVERDDPADEVALSMTLFYGNPADLGSVTILGTVDWIWTDTSRDLIGLYQVCARLNIGPRTGDESDAILGTIQVVGPDGFQASGQLVSRSCLVSVDGGAVATKPEPGQFFLVVSRAQISGVEPSPYTTQSLMVKRYVMKSTLGSRSLA